MKILAIIFSVIALVISIYIGFFCWNQLFKEPTYSIPSEYEQKIDNLYGFHGLKFLSRLLPEDVLDKYDLGQLSYIYDNKTVWSSCFRLNSTHSMGGSDVVPQRLNIVFEKPKHEGDIARIYYCLINNTGMGLSDTLEIKSEPMISPRACFHHSGYLDEQWRTKTVLVTDSHYQSGEGKLILRLVPKDETSKVLDMEIENIKKVP